MCRALLVLMVLFQAVSAAPKQVKLFVALCDNASQGIAPVPAKIGDGNDPDGNLYWGCTDGFAGCFAASKAWKLVKKEEPADKRILRRLIYRNEAAGIEITAEAWRGSEIKACLSAFEAALVSGEQDLCAYIGHNVLMDGEVPPNPGKVLRPCDGIVLCCMSESYFKARLEKPGARPVLLTTQLMYPGSFILRDVLPLWAKGEKPDSLRAAAAAAYARNQKISVKSASGVFSKLP